MRAVRSLLKISHTTVNFLDTKKICTLLLRTTQTLQSQCTHDNIASAFLNCRLTHIPTWFCLLQGQNTGGTCNINESGPRSYSSHSTALSKLPQMIWTVPKHILLHQFIWLRHIGLECENNYLDYFQGNKKTGRTRNFNTNHNFWKRRCAKEKAKEDILN